MRILIDIKKLIFYRVLDFRDCLEMELYFAFVLYRANHISGSLQIPWSGFTIFCINDGISSFNLVIIKTN